MTVLRRLLPWLASLCLASAAVAQDEPCRDAGFSPRLLTPPALTIPRDAALVVGLVGEGTTRGLPPVALARGRRTTRLVSEAIAPGLFRLRPDARAIAGSWQLTGVPGATPLVFGRPGVDPPPIAPAIVALERYLVATGTEPATELRARFSFPIPGTVIAAITYFGDDPAPDGFVPTIPDAEELVLYRQAGTCARLAEGASAPPAQGTVRVAFVGRHGAVSPPSAPARLAPP